jgi:DNA polymerase III alpha subunit
MEDIVWVTFERAEPLGIKDTYDIQMEGPYHNFLAGNIIVHNCGDAELDGKTLKARYIDRKNGVEEPVPPHPSLSPVLESTLGILIYQEQAMEAAKVIAGFDGVQADSLRKAAGKKLPELMAKIKTLFIDGAKAKGAATEEEAALIFSIIEASQRYSFNKCLCPYTIVHTRQGPRTLKEVRVGTHILDHQDNYVKIKAKYNNGPRETFLYTFNGGSILRCTPDHKILTPQGLTPIEVAYRDGLQTGTTFIIGKSDPQTIETMDIEVDNNDHVFCANSVCVSNSHSISYALDAIYFGAYAKAHFPRAFFLAELVYAKDIEEIGAVIDDSLNFNIEVCKPDLRLMNEEFTLTNRCIQYGLGRIKGCGEAKLKKLVEAIDNNNVSEMDWPQLMLCLSKTGSDAAYALIYAGALDFTLLTRTKMAFELSIFNRLNEKQQRYVVERKSLSNALTEMLEMGSGKTTLCYNKRSLAALEIVINEFNKPPKSMRDTPNQIFDWEMQYMGYAFTTSEVDESIANCTCHDFVEGKTLKEYTLVGTIARIKLILTKGKQPGQEMAFVEFKDSTNKVSGVMFPKQWLEYRQKLFEGNKLMFIGTRGSGNKNDSLIINRVMQL